MTPVLTVRAVFRHGFTLIELLVVIAIIAILAAIIIPAVMAVQIQAANAKDLEQVRGMGNAFTLYNKKYNYFPAMIDMSGPLAVSINAVRLQDLPKGVSMKLLMSAGFIEDPKIFFSPRETSPTPLTLTQMTAELNPKNGVTGLDFASTYAYDCGHSTFHGSVPFFGNRHGFLSQAGDVTHVLTCDQTAKEIEPTAPIGLTWTFQNHKATTTVTSVDDIYLDDSPAFEWRDSFLDEPARTGF